MSRTVNALQSALRAEHAAVYGYGVLGARLRGVHQQTAKTYWDAHRLRRDDLTSRLAGQGARPDAAAPVYSLPVKPTSARSAAQLAAALENDLVGAYVGLAGASDPALRSFAARAMQEAMTRSARWSAAAGQPARSAAFPGLPPEALSPKARPGE
ncbi:MULTISPECIES: ferritin-like domain-containing protein [Actinomadura]|uniref:Ferritin-like domain-containing protein n=1 Tax=Actinomadura yumaensis TaxID=111807 RepID=A0ABW2CWB2_9ACTN|nr:ferritin-like domain-containing protein [Actinomadura sp. J1-007]MWK33216.1 DUF4439 domain-containing protein [Actinomadura sp. J1-007]